MGLDDFWEDESDNEDDSIVKENGSEIDITEIEMDECCWEVLLASHPFFAETIAEEGTDEEARALIQKIDELLEGDSDEVAIGDKNARRLREARENIAATI